MTYYSSPDSRKRNIISKIRKNLNYHGMMDLLIDDLITLEKTLNPVEIREDIIRNLFIYNGDIDLKNADESIAKIVSNKKGLFWSKLLKEMIGLLV